MSSLLCDTMARFWDIVSKSIDIKQPNKQIDKQTNSTIKYIQQTNATSEKQKVFNNI